MSVWNPVSLDRTPIHATYHYSVTIGKVESTFHINTLTRTHCHGTVVLTCKRPMVHGHLTQTLFLTLTVLTWKGLMFSTLSAKNGMIRIVPFDAQNAKYLWKKRKEAGVRTRTRNRNRPRTRTRVRTWQIDCDSNVIYQTWYQLLVAKIDTVRRTVPR